MGGISTDCLYSTVRCNVPGGRIFGFLPPHGRKLDYHEEFTVFGDIKQAVIKFERSEARRGIISFEKALQRGDLSIMHTPAPILEDDANPGGGPRQLRLRNGVLGVADPCWTSSTSLTPPLG